LLESSECFEAARHTFKQHGILVGDVGLDLAAMLRRKDLVVAALTKGVEALFKKNKVTRYAGHARLAGPSKVIVTGAKETVELTAPHIIVATGSRSTPLKGIEMDGDRIGTSTEALQYAAVPGHLVVIGAGYIGLELGSVWRRLGSKVTVLEYLDRILPGMDMELAAEAKRIFEKQGIEFRLKSKVTSARVIDGRCVVRFNDEDLIDCDRVLVSVGRTPNTDDLGLDTVGIQPDE
ncbi:MAG: FAD-dependent oxidoreductase, partial [Phycisphaerales bacterium]|nr:FAD-dependent oxidoreductase [Phycisphaerales bacterium]